VRAKKRWLPAVCVALVLATGWAAAASGDEKPRFHAKPEVARAQRSLRANPRLIRRYRAQAWRLEALMGRRRTRAAARPNTLHVLRFWRGTARRMRRLAARPPHKGGWLCIHRYEASWRDSYDPYWGGLQMDRGFMLHYAPRHLLRRGWADRWTPLEQMWVAERAYRRGRGFWPWPNTARICGLL
jgi:hypothetical protein